MKAPIPVFVLSLLLAGGCGMTPPLSDLEPPAVWRVAPQGEAVALRAKVEVIFTEPVHPASQALGLVALVHEDEFDQALLHALDDPPLSSAMQARCVPARLDFSLGGSALTLTPEQELAPTSHYAVLVSADIRDLDGNALAGWDGDGATESAHAVHWFRTE